MLDRSATRYCLRKREPFGINIFRQMQDKIAVVIMVMIMPKMGRLRGVPGAKDNTPKSQGIALFGPQSKWFCRPWTSF